MRPMVERSISSSAGLGLLLAVLCTGIGAPPTAPVSAQERPTFENLQVLPEDISRSELNRIMLDNLAGLGLPRRANEGCLFCHVGSISLPSSEWDWASDEKPMKVKARAMMAMVREINDEHLTELVRTSDRKVGCYMCHAGRTNPMPLPELLLRKYAEGGVDGVIESYRELRARYFAADAYDFRTPVLAAVADAVARGVARAPTGTLRAPGAAGQRDPIEDAAAIHRLNIEHTGDPAAHQGLIRLRMVEALDAEGTEQMLARYQELRAEHPPRAYHHSLLDELGWRLFRSARRRPALRLFQLNYEEHPDEYTAVESLAWANESVGNHERAVELAEVWLRLHPDHELGRRLLTDLQGR